jgi:hypothetical protein
MRFKDDDIMFEKGVREAAARWLVVKLSAGI